MASTTRSALHPSRLVLPVLLGSLLAVPTLASPDAAVTEPADILVITVDTVRRDHLSCYGHETLTTPNIDQLAAEGVLWTDCQAAISVTGPSHVTMFTGVYPQVHGAFRNGVKVKPERMTLGELLGAAGYQRQAFVAGWTLKDRVCGLAKGFDTYDDDMDKRYSVVNLMRKADEVTNDALAWFEGEQKRRAKGERDPYFVFVHYFDPHEPYEPVPGPALRPNPQADGGPALEKYDTHLEAYDREIAYTDGEIGRLVDELKKMGLLKDAIIALTADHGQSFGEHGYGGPEGKHGRRTYQSCLAAPLIFWSPSRIPGGRKIDWPVAHVDLFPTLADLAGVTPEHWPADVVGENLAEVLREPDVEPPWGQQRRIRYSMAFGGATGNTWNLFRFLQNKRVKQANPRYLASLEGTNKLIVDPKAPKQFELYDLSTDPGEFTPLTGSRRQAQAARVTKLLEWYEATRTILAQKKTSKADLEALKSLGYVD